MKKSLEKYDNRYYTFYSYLVENGILNITWDNELILCDVCDRMFEEKYYSVLNNCQDIDLCYICGDTNKYVDY